MNTLGKGYNNREVIFFILCAHLESLMSMGLIGLLLMMLPTDMALQGAETMFLDEEPGLLYDAISMILYFFVMMVVETLYVSGGFVLYLNRRIILEGWDIELAFRKLTERCVTKKQSMGAVLQGKVQSVIVILIFSSIFLFTGGIPQNAQAISQNASKAYEKILPLVSKPPLASDASAEIIQQVMAEPIFNRFKQIETLEYTGKDDKDKDDLELTRSWLTELFEKIGKFLAFIFEVMLWIIALLVLFLLVKYRERLRLGLGGLFKQREEVYELPDMLFGLDVREESLPDNVSEQAMILYKKQDYRASLALLYRATLAQLVKNYHFNLAKGATEGDCLKWVTNVLSSSGTDFSGSGPSEAKKKYFIELTQAWQLTAYANRFISAEQMEKLCLNWDRFYATSYATKRRSDNE
jgi:hypothetical protein